MTARVDQVVSALQARKGACDRITKREQWAFLGGIQSDNAIEALGPISLQVNASAKIKCDFPAEIPGVAGINRRVKILIGSFGRLGDAAAISIAEKKRGNAAPARRCLRTDVAKGAVVRVGCGRFVVELEQAGGIVALIVVVAQDAVFESDLQSVLAEDLRERRVEAVGIVKRADAAARALGAPT